MISPGAAGGRAYSEANILAGVRTLLLALLIGGGLYPADFVVGYRMEQREIRGRLAVSEEPVWVYEYHRLRLRYRAGGVGSGDGPVLTLRPGAVGPVTPGAMNPENPFAAGQPVVVVRERDLVGDGAVHALEVELRGRMRTAQVDQLVFTVPAGGWLAVEELEFVGDGWTVGAAPGLPAGVRMVAVLGASKTTVRGREAVRIEAGGVRGGALYWSMAAEIAGVAGLFPGEPFEKWRPAETREVSDVVVRLKYTDGTEEEQFPLLVEGRRHRVVNRRAAVYSVELDGRKGLESATVVDGSAHVGLAVFAAGVSKDAAPVGVDATLATPAAAKKGRGRVDFEGSKWFEVRGAGATGTVRRNGKTVSLTVVNGGREAGEFTVVFPSVTARVADPYFLFPAQRALIGRDEDLHEAEYSGKFPLQFVDVFSPGANAGAALIVNDTSGRGKSFRLKKTGEAVAVGVEYRVRLGPGETFRAPDVLVEEHGGDWREGFEAYRRWVAGWYRARVRPEWLKTAFWARRDYPIGGSGRLFDVKTGRYTFETLLENAAELGGADFIDISGWALSNETGRVGDYPIELGGAPDLRRNIEMAAGRGVRTGLYFEGYLIDRNSRVGKRSGAGWQIVTADGRPRWWQGGAELFACPYVPEWQAFLSGRVAAVARETGAAAVYLDEYGFGHQRCWSRAHGHEAGVGTMEGEFAMVAAVRRALAAAGRGDTAIYIEETPPDAAAGYYDAAFCYALPFARETEPAPKLNLWRFVFPEVRLWDMLSVGVHPKGLGVEDFRLSFWHGNGVWLKGHSESWYSPEVRTFLRWAHGELVAHAGAFGGRAEPLVEGPAAGVFVNRFTGGGEVVWTLFNAGYRTVRFRFGGREMVMGPRAVDVVARASS